MSVLTVLATDTALAYGGTFASNTVGAKAAKTSNSLGGQVEGIATGTDLTCQMFGQAGETVTVTIDGGTPTTFNPAAAWTTQTIFTGLSDTAHSWKIKTNKSGAGFALEVANAFAVTGAAPAMALPTGYAATQTTGLATASGIQGDLSMSDLGTQTGNSHVLGGSDCASFRCRAKISTLKLWQYEGGDRISLAIDGVIQGLEAGTAIPNTLVYNWYDFTGLDPLVEHEYTIYKTGPASGNPNLIANAMFVGGTGLNTLALAQGPTWAWYGDSILKGSAGTSNNPFIATPHQFSYPRRIANVTRGVSGAAVWDNGQANARESDASIATIPAGVDAIINNAGVNDATQSVGVESAAQFQTSYINMLTKQRARIGPSKWIYCLGILNTTNATGTSNRTAFNAAIAAAVSAMADPFIMYIPTDGWITPGTDTSDGLHPNAGGYVKFTAQLNLALPTSFAVSRGNAGLMGLINRRRR